jgi:formylglycine-generating enzyme required for sulfatase activity
MIHRASLTRVTLSFLCASMSWTFGCAPQEREERAPQVVTPDLTRLPPSLRRRLSEAEKRISILEEQRDKMERQVKALRSMEHTSPKAREEVEEMVAQGAHQQEQVEGSLDTLRGLVHRIKLQAVADEIHTDTDDTDHELMNALEDVVELYDELGELESVKRDATQGKAEAQFKLATRYEKGEGVEQSDISAFKWFAKAANQGHLKAALAAGFYSKHGRGTAVDISRAIEWYTVAADGGLVIAASNLSRIYSDEADAEHYNLKSAKRWLTTAAKGGVKRAQLSLAQLYLREGLKDSKRISLTRRLLKSATFSKQERIQSEARSLLDKLNSEIAPQLAQKTAESIRWMSIKAGEFMMGDERYDDAAPSHRVTLKAFSISETEVTVAQYQACVDAGHCAPAKLGHAGCESDSKKRGQRPANCVSWEQARTFAQWIDADLPSEAEWEYTARSAGKYSRYPWGEHASTCERAVMRDERSETLSSAPKKKSAHDKGCGRGRAWEVCSKSKGVSVQGVCDMVGNLWEWTLDEYRPTYEDAPTDGSARCADPECTPSPTARRVIRGGGYMTKATGATATMRSKSNRPAVGIGFRVIKRAK